MITIETSIPAPAPMKRGDGNRKYPFAQMKVGDSIFFENAGHDHNAVQAAKRYFSRNNKIMTTRKIDGGIRIWRLS